MRSGHAMLAMLLTSALTSHASIHRHGQRPMIASGLTRRSLFATVESGAPSPLAGGRMQPKSRTRTRYTKPAASSSQTRSGTLVYSCRCIQTCKLAEIYRAAGHGARSLGCSSHLSTMNTLASLARSICEAVVQHQSHVEAPARLLQLSIKLQRNRELSWPY